MKIKNDKQFLLKAKNIKPKTLPSFSILAARSYQEDTSFGLHTVGGILLLLGAFAGFFYKSNAMKWSSDPIQTSSVLEDHHESSQSEISAVQDHSIDQTSSVTPVVKKAYSLPAFQIPEVENLEALPNDAGFRFSIKTDILFIPGTIHLNPDAQEILEEMVDAVIQHVEPNMAKAEIEVQGHTDDSPVVRLKNWYPSNWELSAARAGVILHFFENSGFEKQQLKLVGYGDAHLISDDEFTNRRVIIEVRHPNE